MVWMIGSNRIYHLLQRDCTYEKNIVTIHDLTPSLKDFLENEVGIDVGSWQTKGLEPSQWPEFGSVQKTTAEFQAAYDTFAQKCVGVAKEVGG